MASLRLIALLFHSMPPIMHLYIVAILALAAPSALCADNPLPARGDNGDMGGIFGIGKNIISAGLAGTAPEIIQGLFTPGRETPKGKAVGPTTVGSGPYPAHYLADPSLPNHTVYAPKSPPPSNVKMPVIVFGNGGCVNIGTLMSSLLTEIASHGYLVIANGPPQMGASMSMTVWGTTSAGRQRPPGIAQRAGLVNVHGAIKGLSDDRVN